MTSVMLATYPEIFAGGAIIAGLPYRCATNLLEAGPCMNPGKNFSPSQWGGLVRTATSHAGPWPKISIWHGNADTTVVPMNASEIVDQWTNVHGIDRAPDVEDMVEGHPHTVFKNATGKAMIEVYTITGMGHGTPIDPGRGEKQCGCAGPFILDVDICSSFHILKFWGLIDEIASNGGPANIRDQLLERIQRLQNNLIELRSAVEQMPTQ
jgi:poly(3-hydroxybutyrate) depolymerase